MSTSLVLGCICAVIAYFVFCALVLASRADDDMGYD